MMRASPLCTTILRMGYGCFPLALVAALLLPSIPPPSLVYAASIFHTDPPAVITFSSPALTILRKDLRGYPNRSIYSSL